jgi:hypothetical protein
MFVCVCACRRKPSFRLSRKLVSLVCQSDSCWDTGKGELMTPIRHTSWVEVDFHTFLTWALDAGKWYASHSGRFTLRGRTFHLVWTRWRRGTLLVLRLSYQNHILQVYSKNCIWAGAGKALNISRVCALSWDPTINPAVQQARCLSLSCLQTQFH